MWRFGAATPTGPNLYANARYYDSEYGRFTTQDSFLGNHDNPPSLHRYMYAHANPGRYVDLTGHAAGDIWDPRTYFGGPDERAGAWRGFKSGLNSRTAARGVKVVALGVATTGLALAPEPTGATKAAAVYFGIRTADEAQALVRGDEAEAHKGIRMALEAAGVEREDASKYASRGLVATDVLVGAGAAASIRDAAAGSAGSIDGIVEENTPSQYDPAPTTTEPLPQDRESPNPCMCVREGSTGPLPQDEAAPGPGQTRDAQGRLRDPDGRYAYSGGRQRPRGDGTHRNTADDREATLYKKYGPEGDFRKHGVTHHEDPNRRYTKEELDGGRAVAVDRGPRREVLQRERELVETDPGPENLDLNQAHFISAASVSGAAVDVGTAFRAAVVDARGGVTVEL